MTTITPFADAVTLNPVRIKKIKPSLSPVKSPKETKPKIRALSKVLGMKPSISSSAEYHYGTAALNFREFSFWDDKGYLSPSLINLALSPVVSRKALQRHCYDHIVAILGSEVPA